MSRPNTFSWCSMTLQCTAELTAVFTYKAMHAMSKHAAESKTTVNHLAEPCCCAEAIRVEGRLTFLESPLEPLPRMSRGCQEEDMTGDDLAPPTMRVPSVLRQSSMGCAMEAPSSPAAISSCHKHRDCQKGGHLWQ